MPQRISEVFDIALPTDEFLWSYRKIGLWKHEIAILTKRTILNVSFCSFCYFGVAFGDGTMDDTPEASIVPCGMNRVVNPARELKKTAWLLWRGPQRLFAD